MLIFLNLVFFRIFPFATQFKATPPAKDKLVHLNQKYKVMKESGNYLIIFIENEDS